MAIQGIQNPKPVNVKPKTKQCDMLQLFSHSVRTSSDEMVTEGEKK